MPSLIRVKINRPNPENLGGDTVSSDSKVNPIIAVERKRRTSARLKTAVASTYKTAQKNNDDGDDTRRKGVASVQARPAEPTAARKKRKTSVSEEVANVPSNGHKIENNTPGNGWDLGNYIKGSKTTPCWISPSRKIKFKYRKDAVLFESLRKKFGSNEVQAWVEYTKIKHSLKQRREVLDVRQYDINLDVSLVRKNNEEDTPGPGWKFGSFSKHNRRRVFWMSPTRKIKFRYRQDAVLFESLRKKFGLDEVQAWVEYTKIKHSLKQSREVLDVHQYDDGMNLSQIRKSNNGETPGHGWEVGSFSKHNRRRVFWMSPTRKIKFRYRQDAVLFESLRKKFGSDEVQAWVEYTKIKHSLKQRREVVDPCQHDCRVGFGFWTEEEHEIFLRGLAIHGRDYVKIATLLPTRSRQQIKSHALRHFQTIGKTSSIPNKGFLFNELCNDVLYNIASFLPTVQSLVSFCLTSKRVSIILENPSLSENLYRCIFVSMFGGERCEHGDYDINLTWKQRWARVHAINTGLQSFTRTMSKSSCTILPKSIGVLRRQAEDEALYQDNPEFTPLDRGNLSPGYFGVHKMSNLPPPPNAGIDWEPPIILNGDFNGIRIFDSIQNFISGKKRNFSSILNENDGQVLSLARCKWNQEACKAQNPPCCFLGFASGCVSALTATLSSDGGGYVFSTERQHHAHSCEVTALTIVDCSSTTDQTGKILFSASHGGQVCYYPNAMNPLENFNMKSYPAFSNSHPIFSMTSTVISKENDSTILLCIGDSNGTVGVWSASSGLLSRCNEGSEIFHLIARHESARQYLVTALTFVQKNMFVSGDNQGDIRVWDLDCTHGSMRNADNLSLSLKLRRHIKSAHNGSVELCMNIRNVLMTSGGNDGNIVGWDTVSWKKIGVFCCHQGKDVLHPTTQASHVLKSCVVGAILTGRDGRLVSLCRDGVISEWVYT
ncbi:hypothetical protein HJC23_013265 [Cyclotella cryptica]|uniref:Uncharacterized protein n=1 Tax=Cyclotella cryptica TaxID=29204 RepID=A0ABD3PKM7_9STRA